MHAVLDAGRGSLTLPRRLVPIVMLLAAGTHDEASSPAAFAELERAGIAVDGTLHPLAARILEVVTGPRFVVTIEVMAETSVQISTIWSRRDRAVVGHPLEPGLFRLQPVEVGLMEFHLAQLTMVGPRPDAVSGAELAAPASLLDELSDQWSARPEVARHRLEAAGVEPSAVTRLIEIHRSRRRTWRIAALWAEPSDSAHDGDLMVVDAGSQGYWRVRSVDDDAGTTAFEPKTFPEVMKLIRGVIPPTG